MAYKITNNSQFSLAYGSFYQDARQEILKFEAVPNPGEASHYILNYQYSKSGRTFRLEGYYKDYSSLVTYNTLFPGATSVLTRMVMVLQRGAISFGGITKA